jgi:hypothetical protein
MKKKTDPIESPYDEVDNMDRIFPKKKYERLLKICKVANKDELGPHQVSQLFVNAIYRFLIGQFSIDDVSMISDELYSHVYKETSQLEHTLSMCGELSFYLRRIYSQDNEDLSDTFVWLMKEVIKYYFSNKEQVVPVKRLIWKKVKS